MNSKLIYLKKLELFKEMDNFKEGHFFAVIDQKIKNHLPQWVLFSPYVFWLKNPEEEKNIEVYNNALEFFLKQGIQRSSKLYAIGGGATSDFAGFIAATILRGINWTAVPTSLLAMVDAAIGGKVGINMPQGKNLLGAFHAPQNIFICSDFLSSLSSEEIISGRGEILKYCFLSKEIHDLVLGEASLENILVECAKYKNRIVEKDFKDNGDRVYLNLGHSLGHAFESSLKLPHGLAVAMGIKYLLKIMKLDSLLTDWHKLVKALNLPLEKMDIRNYPDFYVKEFWKFIEFDKKKIDDSIRLVLVREIGSCYVEELTLKELKEKVLAFEDFNYNQNFATKDVV